MANRCGMVRPALALAMGVLLGLGLLAQAGAQYPPPVGNIVLTASGTTPVVGGDVEVTATVQDENGQPAVGVDCVFRIDLQPGTDASLNAGPFTTDAAGQASTTLHVGSSAGQVVIAVSCGELTAQVLVTAQAAPAAPPASLPATGAEVDDGGSAWMFWALISAGALIGVGGVAFVWRRMMA